MKENIPCKLVNSFNFSEEREIITFEFSISNVKRLLLGLYKPLSVKDDTFVDQIKLALNNYSKSFEDFILKGDFSITGGNWKLNDLMNTIFLEKLIKESPWFHQWYTKISMLVIFHSTFTWWQGICIIWCRVIIYKYSTRVNNQQLYLLNKFMFIESWCLFVQNWFSEDCW